MNIDMIGNPSEFIVMISTMAIIGISLATAIGFFGRLWWTFDLFSHFRVQYLIILTGFSGLALLLGHIEISIIGLIFSLINLTTIAPYYLPVHKSSHESRAYRILLSNVLRPNVEFGKLLQVIKETNPDFMVLIEISELWMSELAPISSNYPYIYTAIRSDNYGMAIFSRFDLYNTQTLYFSDANVPSLVVDANIDGKQLMFIGTHPPPPKSKIENSHRNQQIVNIADFIARKNKPIILLGDLNTTSWSSNFKKLINGSKLKDTRMGFGLQPTWPTHNPLFMVPIDHVLVSAGIRIHNRFTGPAIGSDHRPVIVDFSFDNNPQNSTN